jgi:hypothetical protein
MSPQSPLLQMLSERVAAKCEAFCEPVLTVQELSVAHSKGREAVQQVRTPKGPVRPRRASLSLLGTHEGSTLDVPQQHTSALHTCHVRTPVHCTPVTCAQRVSPRHDRAEQIYRPSFELNTRLLYRPSFKLNTRLRYRPSFKLNTRLLYRPSLKLNTRLLYRPSLKLNTRLLYRPSFLSRTHLRTRAKFA